MDLQLGTRPPAVAGQFYPSDPDELGEQIRRLLSAAEPSSQRRPPKALIAPHAGYPYSGPVAASAYACLRPLRDQVTRVVLIGPVHRVWLEGLALPGVARFATPLGTLELDRERVSELLALPQVIESPEAHAQEHSLEVHLPFLQAMLESFQLVPLLVGDASPEQVSEVLEVCWGGPETLVVVSTDLSHQLSHEAATQLDRSTAEWITHSHTPGLDPRRACGARCLDGLIALERRRELSIEILDLRNSGDTAGSRGSGSPVRDRVVGYGAFAVYEGDST